MCGLVRVVLRKVSMTLGRPYPAQSETDDRFTADEIQ